MVAIDVALLKLRAAGFKPDRDIIVLFTGDEETQGKGARLGATEWRKLTDAEYALNADAGGAALRDGRPIGCGMQTAEKTYQILHFSAATTAATSRPRPDNAIYELADALKAPGASLHAGAQRDHPRLLHRAGQTGGRRRTGRGNARLARQSERRCRGRRDRGQ